MKKKIIIVVAIFVILVTLICIPKTTYQKWFGKDNGINTEQLPKEYLTVFVANNKNELVGVKVYLDKVEEDVIKQKWDILTSNMNLIPSGYSTTICPSTVLNSYEIENKKLVLNVSEEINKSAGRLTIETLAWTFCDNEIDEVVLKTNNQVINTINECNFKKISKSLGTNFTYETAYLFESEYTTMVFYKDDLIIPVTYFYKDVTEYDFMIAKLFDYNDMEVTNYKYDITDDKFIITLEDNISINDDFKNSIIETVRLNVDVDSITVSNIDSTIFEQTFAEVN